MHIITRLILGGAQENTILTCEGQHADGHEVTLITGPTAGPEGQLVDRAKAGGYKIIEIEPLIRAVHPIKDHFAYKQLKKVLAELAPDIVHTHSAKAGILGRSAAEHVRKHIANDACCSITAKVNEAHLRTCGRPRIVHTIHGLAFHPFQSNLKNKLYIAAEKHVADQTDAFISVAQAMTDQALAAGIGTPEKYHKVFSGMETENYTHELSNTEKQAIRDEFNIPQDALVIATVARLFELKGHEYVIRSATKLASKFPQAIWLFVGDGILQDDLKKQIANASLTDRFRFAGLVPPQRVGPILQACDMLVHPSLREGLARTLPQSLLCGKPAISFDVDGAKEVIKNDQTGYLVKAKDIEGLVQAQEKLLADEQLRIKLGQQGKAFCIKEFDHKLMVERIQRVYNSIMR
ncbi:MAG: glycosyltransferase family 4 protein [Phycisphaerae bacterium]|nr:glycosyltransferase family 4 protein [Phycisphaerae bacterium]